MVIYTCNSTQFRDGGKRIFFAQAKSARPYLKNNLKQKRLRSGSNGRVISA
jgi:hypothetical protein